LLAKGSCFNYQMWPQLTHLLTPPHIHMPSSTRLIMHHLPMPTINVELNVTTFKNGTVSVARLMTWCMFRWDGECRVRVEHVILV